MKVVEPSFEIWTDLDDKTVGQFIEKCARNCYKSEGLITEDSYKKIIKMLINNGHTAMLEHFSITLKLTTDLHSYKDLTRHRHAAFAIESTRWCNYSGDKFGKELTFIKPYGLEPGTTLYSIWNKHCLDSEISYINMKNNDSTTDQASQVLNQSLKADVVITCNIREWRHILKLRTDKAVYPNLRFLMIDILRAFNEKLPTFFGDLAEQVFSSDQN